MDTCGTCLLCQTGDRLLHLLAYGHHEVGELVHDQYDVGQELVPVDAAELPGAYLLVVLLDVAYRTPRILEQVVAVVHLHTEGVEGSDDTLHVGDDRLVGIGELS